MSENIMRDQVLSKPDLIREVVDPFAAEVQRVLEGDVCRAVERIYLTGCGDSHNAALATELAFEHFTGVPVEALTALQCARYATPFLPPRSMVFGISVSGEVARTIEALTLARDAGATTVAVTGTPGSRITRAAGLAIHTEIEPFPHAPGVRSYTASLLGLYLAAIHMGEVRGRLTAQQAAALREELKATADATEAAIAATDAATAALAEEAKEQRDFVFVGHGPNFGTALFSAAKLMEASGDHALGQDTEEWAHLQYFIRDRSGLTFLIAPPGAGYGRAVEVAGVIKRLGRRLVAIVAEGDAEVAPLADVVLPMPAMSREAFTPLVYCTPAELFAAHLASVRGEPYFRGFTGLWDPATGGNVIQQSHILTDVSAVKPDLGTAGG